MKKSKAGWKDLLRRDGADFLSWIAVNDVLMTKFDTLASALWTHLERIIRTQEDSIEVWRAVPAVLSDCNEQTTYELPGAAHAYAWLHLLDRYARTWSALEKLVAACCLPLGKFGVRALDVGTGPGPSAFAIHDFYRAMMEFATHTGNHLWLQPPEVTCVEFSRSTNNLRHQLAETVFEQSLAQSKNVISLCQAFPDFREIVPSVERKRFYHVLRAADEENFDEVSNQWTSEPQYTAAEANELAQSFRRYRLIIYSNFLTTVDTLRTFEPNLIDILGDAHPGSVLIVIGGKGRQYPEIYEYMNSLARNAAFKLELGGEVVSSADTVVADRVYAEGVKMYTLLSGLAPSVADENECTREVKLHFTESRRTPASSQVWAYRKYNHA